MRYIDNVTVDDREMRSGNIGDVVKRADRIRSNLQLLTWRKSSHWSWIGESTDVSVS